MRILPYKDFRSFDEAIKFVKDNPKSYVIKPTAETPPSTKGLLFIGEEKDGADVIQVLNDYKESWADSKKYFNKTRWSLSNSQLKRKR